MKKFRALGLGILLLAAGTHLSAAPILSEGFADVAALAGDGWVVLNNSSPVGSTSWFQGNDVIFGAQSGTSNSYVAANYNSADFNGVIDNWLLTPEIALTGQTFVRFYTRTDTESAFADRLEVAVSQNGSSTDVVNDFTTVLSINPGLAVPGYPETWTMYTISLASIGSPTTGRIAFHYSLPDNLSYANYVGIDTLSVIATPEPASLGLMAAGLGALAFIRLRRNRK